MEVGFGCRAVSDGFLQSTIVEPIDPFKCCVLPCLEAAPRSTTVNDFSLEQAIIRFCQRIVICIPDTADRRGDLRLCKLFVILVR